jgi:hypothetical protein
VQAQIGQDHRYPNHQRLIEVAPATERSLAVRPPQPLHFVGWQVFGDFLD